MNLISPMKYGKSVALLLVANSLWFCGNAMAEPARSRITMMSQLQVEGPCIASIMGPPQKSCIQWEPNVNAFPTYEPGRRLILSGAPDDLLHVIDADTGRAFAKIVTFGRVITKAVFGDDHAVFYVGTEKGMLYAFDAYSFAPIFSLSADSKINNNLTLIKDAVIFTSSMGTIYCIDGRTGAVRWQIEQPMAKERLRFSQQSNIYAFKEANQGIEEDFIVVPHSDGYLSVIHVPTGKIKKRIELAGSPQANGFPDIVAPMVVFKNNRLWVASYDLGIAIIDLGSLRVREQIEQRGILELATDGSTMFAASADAIFSLADSGKILWKNDISTIKSRAPRTGFPFERFSQGAKRMFYGVPTRMLLSGKRILLSTSLGSIGIFDKTTGKNLAILGHSIGFGALEWAGSDFMAVSRRGLLMKFHDE